MLKKYLFDNRYKLPSDVIGNIIDKYYDNIKSYYALVKSGIKANKPKFKSDKSDKNGLYYYCRSFKIRNNKVRLTVGDEIAKNYGTIVNNSQLVKIDERRWYNKQNLISNPKNKNDYDKIGEKYVQKKYIYDNYYIYLDLPKKVRNKEITLIQIQPLYNNFKIAISYYENKHKKDKKIKLKGEASVDLGVRNLMTIYDPEGNQKIIRGGVLKNINKSFNKKMDKLKSDMKIHNNLNTSPHYHRLLLKRSKLLDAEMNRIVDAFYDNYKTKKEIIVGYNEGWKKNVNMGKENNRRFNEIPYKKLLSKLTEKLNKNGIDLTTVEESYTSKCDSMSLEPLKRKEDKKYNGRRIRRGLYFCKNGIFLNADLNGAINIMRKKIELKEITGKRLMNPERIKI